MNQQKFTDVKKRFLVKQWVNKNKVKNGVTQSYLNWNVDRYSYLDLIDLYVQHLHFMAEHSFIATWNYCQFKRARTNIKPRELLLVNDFAQNYLCFLQNEPQAMHWEHKQVTLHPMVDYYTCPNEHCVSTATCELVHLSEDLKHDAHIVRKLVNESIKVVRNHFRPIPFTVQKQNFIQVLDTNGSTNNVNFFGA